MFPAYFNCLVTFPYLIDFLDFIYICRLLGLYWCLFSVLLDLIASCHIVTSDIIICGGAFSYLSEHCFDYGFYFYWPIMIIFGELLLSVFSHFSPICVPFKLFPIWCHLRFYCRLFYKELSNLHILPRFHPA